jgi:hypothetical protein
MRWTLESNVSDVLGLGPRTAAQLLSVGISSARQLLAAKAPAIACRIPDGRVSTEVVACWQREASLVLEAPELAERAIRLLAAAGFHHANRLAASTPTELVATVERIQRQDDAAWIAKQPPPTVREASDWILAAKKSLLSEAA